MKRDMDLIKAILIKLETECSPFAYYSIDKEDFPGADETQIQEHCRLIAERGLAVGKQTRGGWNFSSLTWDGHDFLDNARENKVWQAAKKAAGNLSFGVFQEVLLRAASAFAIKQLGIQ